MTKNDTIYIVTVTISRDYECDIIDSVNAFTTMPAAVDFLTTRGFVDAGWNAYEIPGDYDRLARIDSVTLDA